MLRQLIRDFALGMRTRANRIVGPRIGGRGRPVFYDIDATFPALRVIDREYEAIRAEVLALMPRSAEMPRYHEVDVDQTNISGADERAWRTFFVHLADAGDGLPNSKLAPRTAAVVRGIPGVLQAFFSILDPRKNVPAHHGPSFHYLRYHLGLKVPPVAPPSIRVKDQHYTWKEGESVLFDDSWEHEITNHCDETRVVLIVDVLRPLPWHLSLLNRFWIGLYRLTIQQSDIEAMYGLAALKDPKLRMATPV